MARARKRGKVERGLTIEWCKEGKSVKGISKLGSIELFSEYIANKPRIGRSKKLTKREKERPKFATFQTIPSLFRTQLASMIATQFKKVQNYL